MKKIRVLLWLIAGELAAAPRPPQSVVPEKTVQPPQP